MVGVVIATHGPLAQALSESVSLIMGQNETIKCIGLFHGDDIDTFFTDVKDLIVDADEGEGVLVFTDMYGGSPSNAVAVSMNELKDRVKVECLLGVNLPMILETIAMRQSMTLEALTDYINQSGQNSIDRLSNRLRSE